MTRRVYASLREAIIGRARRRRLCPEYQWDQLREDVERAYARGDLSDGEHDDLFNLWLNGGKE